MNHEETETKLHNHLLKWGINHFAASELLDKAYRTVGKATNEPPPIEVWGNIIPTLTVLDQLRDTIGKPITIHSAYRNSGYNAAVGGERHSQHLAFRAIDFSCDSVTPEKLAQILHGMRGRRFSALWKIDVVAYGQPLDIAGLDLYEAGFTWRGGIGIYPTFVHVDCRGYDADWSR